MINLLKSILISLLLILCSVNLHAIDENPASVTVVPSTDNSDTFLLKISVLDGWDLYGPYKGEDGIPINFIYSDFENIKHIDVIWPVPINVPGSNKNSNNVYRGNIEATLKISRVDLSSIAKGTVTLNMSACKDICKSFQESFKIETGLNVFDSADISVFFIFLSAVLGGFILNFMPCVLPVVTLKVYSIINCYDGSKMQIRFNAISICLGIVATFLSIAIFALLTRGAGEYVGWGFHFQNPKFLICLSIILFISAIVIKDDISLIPIPGFLSNNRYLSSFSSGGLATLLSTPCTAPFITPAFAFALTQSWEIVLLLHLCIGIGMSMPFIFLAVYPAFIKLLPKPGVWMVYLKQVFAVVMILGVVWLLYIISNQLCIKSAIFIFGCLILLKFFLTQFHGVRAAFLSSLLILCIISFPTVIYNSKVEKDKKLDNYWEEFSEEKIQLYRSQGEVVFVDITADWCITCKANKFFVLDDIELLEFLSARGVKMLRGDITTYSEEVTRFMKKYKRSGIPFNIMYGPKKPNIVIFSEILTILDVKKGVEIVKNDDF